MSVFAESCRSPQLSGRTGKSRSLPQAVRLRATPSPIQTETLPTTYIPRHRIWPHLLFLGKGYNLSSYGCRPRIQWKMEATILAGVQPRFDRNHLHHAQHESSEGRIPRLFAVAHLGSESHALAMACRHFSDAVPFAALDSPRPWSLREERHAVRMFENPYRAYRGMKPGCSYFSPGDICK